jgi:predicted Zn-dependent peptidase
MNVERTKLANGMRVVTAAMPEVESVSVGVWVGVGGRYEEQALSGVSHFIEHLLFKGTKRRRARDISNAIEGRGGYLNAFTQEESTCFYARVAYDRLDGAMDVLADMYLNSLFAPKEVDKERGVVVEEIMMYRDQPQQVVQELLGAALWEDHPLGRPISGQPETLRAMTRADIVGFKRAKYVASRTVVAVAGKVRHEDAVRRAEKLFGGLRDGAAPACASVTRRVGQQGLSLRSKEIEQNHVAMGFRLFGREDPRRYALKVLCTALGGNMSSRLFQTVRERHGLAYSIASSVHLFRETGVLEVSAGLDKKRALDGMGLTLRELRRLRDQPIGAPELRRAKDYLIGQLRLGLESTSNQMMWIGENLITRNRFVPPQESIEGIEAVTAADVRRLARQILTRETLSLAMVAPGLDDGFRKRLNGLLKALPLR